MKYLVILIGITGALVLGCGDDDSNDATMTSGDNAPAQTSDEMNNQEANAQGGLTGDEPGWNQTCTTDDDCDEDVPLCSKQPGALEGYCSTPCTTTAECPYGEWTCNVIGGCDEPMATWCGPAEETVDFAPIVTECQ